MALTDSLISYWKVDEVSGNRIDAVTATGNDLTDNNTVTSQAGIIGNEAVFVNANSEYLSRADNASLSVDDIDFTLSCWVTLDNKDTTQAIIAKSRNSGGDGDFDLIYLLASDRFRWSIMASDGTRQVELADVLGSPSTAQRYFIVCWHDSVANTTNIQINNGAVDSAATTVTVANGTGAFQIGGFPDNDVNAAYLDGKVDEVGFWKRVLTADERTQLYNAGAGLTYPFGGGTSGLFSKIW